MGAGSFAAGFIQAFLAARRMRLEQDRWHFMQKYYQTLMQQRAVPGLVFQHGADSGRANAEKLGETAPAASPKGEAASDIPPEGRALLDTISGPESGGKYDVRYTPQGGAKFNGFDDHPRIRENAGRSTSDAAGRYQFLSSTWDPIAQKLGLKDFSPASQDRAAWDLAQTTYKQQTGKDLGEALRSGDPKTISGVADALKGQWPSLPGGSQQGTTADKFASTYNSALKQYAPAEPAASATTPAATPAPASATTPAATPAPAAASSADSSRWSSVFGKAPTPGEATAIQKYGVENAIDLRNNPSMNARDSLWGIGHEQQGLDPKMTNRDYMKSLEPAAQPKQAIPATAPAPKSAPATAPARPTQAVPAPATAGDKVPAPKVSQQDAINRDPQHQLYFGDSVAQGAAQAAKAPTDFTKVGASPETVLSQLSEFANDRNIAPSPQMAFANRDINISTGVSNLQANGQFDRKAFDSAGLKTVQNQLEALADGGADMSRVTVYGVGPNAGGDYANGKIGELTEAYGAQFRKLDPSQYSKDGVHPSNYDSLINPQGGKPSASIDPAASNQFAVSAPVNNTLQVQPDVNPSLYGGANASALPTETAAMYSPNGPAGPNNLADPYNIYGSSDNSSMSNSIGDDAMGGGLGGGFGGGGGMGAIGDDSFGGFGGGFGGGEFAAAKGGLVRRYADGGEVDDDIGSGDTQEAALPVDDTPAPIQPAGVDDSTALPVDDVRYRPDYLHAWKHTMPHGGPRITSGGSPSISAGGGGYGGGVGRMPSGANAPPNITPQGVGLDPTDPQITDGQGGLSDGAVNAIKGGVSFLAQMVGGQGAIPGNGHVATARDGFHNGEYSLSHEQAQQVKKATDPSGTLDDGMANIGGLEALHKFYLAQGDIGHANAAAAAMLEYSKETAAKYGAEAYNRMHKGDVEGAAKMLERGYDEIPDGNTAVIKPLEDGSMLVTQRDMQGKVTRELRASPQQVMAAALGLKNGTLYWQALNDAVAPRQKASEQPMSPQFQKWAQSLTGGDAPAAPAQQPQQAIPAQPQPKASPASAAQPSPADQSAPDAQPASTQAVPAGGDQPPTAVPVTPESNTPPVPASAAPQSEGAIPTSAAPPAAQAPGQPDLEQAAFVNQVYARLPKMPPQLASPPPAMANPREQAQANQYLAAARKQWVDNIFKPAKAEADKIVQSRRDFVLEQWKQNRQQSGATFALDRGNQLQTQRDKATADRQMEQERFKAEQAQGLEKSKAQLAEESARNAYARETYKPMGIDAPPLVGDEGDAYKHANNLLPSAFSPPGTDPQVAAQAFSKKFSEEDRQDLSDAAVRIARLNGGNSVTAAKAVAAITMPKTADGEDQRPYDVRLDKATQLVHVFPKNGRGLPVVIPQDTYSFLVGVRAQQRQLLGQQQMTDEEQQRRNAAINNRMRDLSQRQGEAVGSMTSRPPGWAGTLAPLKPNPVTGDFSIPAPYHPPMSRP